MEMEMEMEMEMQRFKERSVEIAQWIWVWVWWALEQFAVLFLWRTEKVDKETGSTAPCSTCWWYRGVLLGLLLGLAVGRLSLFK